MFGGDLGTAGTIGEQGTIGDTYGSQGQSLGDTFGDLGTVGTIGDLGTFGDQVGGTFGSEGQALGDMFGDLGTVGTIGDLGTFGDQGGIFGSQGQDLGPSFTDQSFSNLTTFADMPGLNVNPDIAERGTFDPNNPSQFNNFLDDQGRSFTFDPSNPNYVTDPGMLNARDGQINSALAPGERGPSSPFAQQDLIANPLNPQDIMNIDPKGINVAPLNIGPTSLDLNAITAMERGQQLETARGVLDPIDPQQYQGPFQPAEPDARSAVQSLMEAIQEAGRAASENFGFVGKAGAETLGPQSQFQSEQNLNAIQQGGPMSGQQGLATAFLAMEQANPQTAQNNPGLMAAMQSFANPEAGKGIPGLPTNPEAPSYFDLATNPNTFTSNPNALTSPAQTNPNMTPTINPDVFNPATFSPNYGPNPTQEEPAPTQVTPQELGPTQLTQQEPGPTQLTSQELGPTQLTLQEPGPTQLAEPTQSMMNPWALSEPGNIAPPTAFDPFTTYAATQGPFAAPEDVTGRTSQPDIVDIARQSLDPFTITAPAYTTLSNITLADPMSLTSLSREAPDVAERGHVNPLAPDVPVTPSHVNPMDVTSRGQTETRGQTQAPSSSRGQESRGTFAPTSRGQTEALGRGITSLGRGTDRGTGRDSPGVQGLPAGLRGNEIAQALVSRGFDANLVGAALTINDGGKMLSSMLEAAGLSHAQAVATANAARGAVEAQHGLPSNRR